ncbi:MAG: S9 family peptidase, partial [Planctomycetes bacterium]|nr:S9 family peptidase [Planctomycetota bacterium]
MFRITGCAILLLLSAQATPSFAQKRPMEIQDLFRFQRVAEPRISPDGKLVVYQVTTVNFDQNKSSTNLWIAATDAKTPPRQLTTTPKSDRHPRWSPDGKQILFESNRGGSMQLWVIALDGGEARQLTSLSTGASSGIWSPDGSHIAFVSSVFPEFSEKPFKESDALNKKKLEEAEKSPVKAKVFSRLFFRHWDEYVEDKRQHLFVMASPPREGGESSPNPKTPPPYGGGSPGSFSEPRDVTPGDRDTYPNSTTFSVGDDFVFSPSGKYLVFTAAPDRDEAWSTNYDLCRVSINGGKVETLTTKNKAADGSPRFSPDGKSIAFRAQKKTGYEADKWDIMTAACDADGAISDELKNLTASVDVSVNMFAWSDAKTIIFTADDDGTAATYRLRMGAAQPERFHFSKFFYGNVLDLSIAVPGKIAEKNWTYPPMAVLVARMDAPAEVYFTEFAPDDNAPHRIVNLSQANRELLAKLDLPRPESVKVKVEGAEMQMWILKPPGFDPAKKWPVVYLVHGG